MTLFDTSSLMVFLGIIAVVALVAAGTSVAALSTFFVTNRKVRLARHESFGRYYGGLVLNH